MTMTKLDEARAFFAQDRFATCNGAVIEEIGEAHAVCSLTIGENHCNAMGNVMGGVVFMLADFAFAVVSNFGRRPTVSASSQITFLRTAKGKKLTARAELIREGRSSVYSEVSVMDEPGNLIARVTANGSVVG